MMDFAQERAVQQRVAARVAASPGNGVARTPKSFAELLKGGGARAAACRCGATATVRVQMTVREFGEGGGKGSGRGSMAGPVPPAIATHNAKLCEPCAVEAFAAFREAHR